MVVRYAYIRWSKTLISGSGQQAKVQDSRHSYHSRQRVARYACFILVPWHSYHQKYAQKRANSGKVCPHLVVISGSVQHSYHQVIDLGYAELNWANGGKVCLFFLFCFHCSQQVTFFLFSTQKQCLSLEEKSKNFASQMFSSGFFVVHDTSGGGHNDVTVKK